MPRRAPLRTAFANWAVNNATGQAQLLFNDLQSQSIDPKAFIRDFFKTIDSVGLPSPNFRGNKRNEWVRLMVANAPAKIQPALARITSRFGSPATILRFFWSLYEQWKASTRVGRLSNAHMIWHQVDLPD